VEYRAYTSCDSPNIENLFVSVFTDSEGKQEGTLIGKLVKDLLTSTNKRDLYGFIAIRKEQIVGAIFFSRLSFERDIEAFILSPVAVHTDYQGMGIGQALITHGLQEMKKRAVMFVTTYGDPAFYSKVGFHHLSQDMIEAPFELSQPEGWLGQSLSDTSIDTALGHCSCVKAFNNPAYW
jgi:predicted N-acetyltransferase YhbS